MTLKPQEKNLVRQDILSFSNEIRKEVLKRAKDLPGYTVAKVLFQVTDEMYDGGIDDAWGNFPAYDIDSSDVMFDITWLTMFASELEKARKLKRKKPTS